MEILIQEVVAVLQLPVAVYEHLGAVARRTIIFAASRESQNQNCAGADFDLDYLSDSGMACY